MFAGFDTSNYTTSAAVFDGKRVIQKRKLLTVKSGQRGLRQSEAVFQHTVNMPLLLEQFDKSMLCNVKAVGVSNRPRNIDGSYMPCFLVGENTAQCASAFRNVPIYKTSHQIGHILAALYSVNRLDLINRQFIAFHVSGGTTEALMVTPDDSNIINTQLIAKSNDLKGGQAVDRTGIALGLDFPCGKELEKLALQSNKKFKIKPSMDGMNCSLSGIENKVNNMIECGESKYDIAFFAIDYIRASIEAMTSRILDYYGNYPIVFAGGVMSNSIIKKSLTEKYSAYFAAPEYSCDNAAGTAVYAYLKYNIRK